MQIAHKIMVTAPVLLTVKDIKSRIILLDCKRGSHLIEHEPFWFGKGTHKPMKGSDPGKMVFNPGEYDLMSGSMEM